MIKSIFRIQLLAGCVNCIKMFSLTSKYDNDSINMKSVWKWEIDIIFQMLIGKSVTHFNEINKCSFDFLNQFNY